MAQLFRVSETVNQSENQELRQRIENVRKIAEIKTKKTGLVDRELLIWLLNMAEMQQQEKGLTRSDKNVGKIQELITKQMDINATDNETVALNGKPIYVNKRRITTAFVQQSLGCSFAPVKAWFDDEQNQAMLDKHHAKYGITESYNRLVSKALKQAAKE